MESLPVMGFTAITCLGAVATCGLFVGSAIYDIKAIKKRKPLVKTPYATRFKRRPLVSVVVLVRNQQSSVSTVLATLRSSSYKKLDVLVVDNASTDESVASVKEYMQANPKQTIRLVSKRKQQDEHVLRRFALRSTKGEFILFIDGGTAVYKDTLKQAVNHFLLDDELVAVTARRVVVPTYSIRNQAKQLGSMLANHVSQTKSVLGLDAAAGVVMYRRQPAMRLQQQKPAYTSDIWVTQLKKPRVKHAITTKDVLGWMAWALLATGLSYTWYLGVYQRVMQPIGILWLAATLIGVLLLIRDEHASLSDKLRIVGLLPLWFVFSCIYSLMRVLSPLQIISRLRIRVHISLAN